ncbi:MAG: tRNA (adenosine(37)-N6)-threonylcarbamoyltransferase complex dimerization subunit type 1 TsaB [Planctomycetes bacterium]|nr:tRNA (adenosine(37)-N6)-threonylcarbamoyltransferase complex dimerization subunit type 1 TsaB [Planctomycetota bacterium]
MTAAVNPDAPLLAFETSGLALGVALWGPRGLILEKRVLEGARHGQALGPVIQEVLALSNNKVADLAAVAVSLGPGSWTGLRIGLAAAKALAWGASLKLVGVPSFEALAVGALHCHPPRTPGVLITARYAYSEGHYAGIWRETEAGPRRLLEDSVLQAEEVPGVLAEVLVKEGLRGAAVRICGDRVCLEALAGVARAGNWEVLEDLQEVPAGCLAECAWERLRAGKALGAAAEIHALAPLYLRASDPELKLKRKQGA